MGSYKIPILNMTFKGVLFVFLIAIFISYLFGLDKSLEPVENYVWNSKEVVNVVGEIEDVDIVRMVYGAFKKHTEYHVNRYYLNVVGSKSRAYISVYVEYDYYKGIRHHSIVNIGIDEIRIKKVFVD